MVAPWRVLRRAMPQVVPAGLSPFGWVRYGRYCLGEFTNPGRKGPKTMLPQPGTYKAKTAQGVVYETEGGALMVAFDFGIDEQTSIVGRICLVKKDGEVLQNNVRSLKEAFGWDGADPFWLADTDLSPREVEIVVEMEQGQDGQARPTVRWINAPGRGGGMAGIKPADRTAVLAKYGMKFRALAGGVPVKHQGAQGAVPHAQPAAAGAPKAPPPAARPAPAPKHAVVAAPPTTIQEAWEAFCQAAGTSFDEQQLQALWYKAVAELTGKADQAACTPEDWGAVRAGAEKFVRGQIPM